MNVKRSLKTSLICGAALSNLLLTGCQSFPKITICVSDPEAGGLQCSYNGEPTLFKPYSESGNYICRSPEDEQLVIEWIKRQCNSSKNTR